MAKLKKPAVLVHFSICNKLNIIQMNNKVNKMKLSPSELG